MMIEYVSFGKLVFRGKVYRSDCIIYGENINSRWWRKEGNRILFDDLKDILELKPEIIVIGKGFINFLDISEDVVNKLVENGINVVIKNTDEAVYYYNNVINSKKVVGIFHLV